MALVVCHLIPDTHPLHYNIRCRMTFEVLQNQITEILGQGNFEQDNKKFILSELRIPADWLYANKALYAQHYGMSQSAIYEWL